MTFQGSDALPGNASELERSMSDTDWARLDAISVQVVRSLVDPATCPAEMLPWLAWSMSVDTWNPAWPEAVQRAVIAASPAAHRVKGTRKAVRLALEALGVTFDIVEWWEAVPAARRGTFTVTAWSTGEPVFDLALVQALREAIRGAKRKSIVGNLRLGLRTTGDLFGGGSGQALTDARFFIDTGL